MLKSILSKIKANEELIEFEPDPESLAYPAQQANRRNAIEENKVYVDAYKKALIEKVLLIVATGDDMEVFRSLAEDTGAFSADLDVTLDMAVEETNPSLFMNKVMMQDAVSYTTDAIENIAAAVNVNGFYLDSEIESVFVDSKEQYADFIASKLAKEDKSLALFLISMHTVTDAAIESGFDQKVFPLVLTTRYPDVAKALVSNTDRAQWTGMKTSLVSVGAGRLTEDTMLVKSLTKSSVEEVFGDIKEKVLGIKRSSKDKNKKNVDTKKIETTEQGE